MNTFLCDLAIKETINNDKKYAVIDKALRVPSNLDNNYSIFLIFLLSSLVLILAFIVEITAQSLHDCRRTDLARLH